MGNLLLTPPLDFLLLLAVAALLSLAFKGLAAKGGDSAGKGEPYACGQDVNTGRIQPSYTEFFSFAFFFTILHVTALVLGTVPANAVWLAMPFLAIAVLAIVILFRRD
ncbi:MAG: hypothetical protein FWC55_01610 [Firmicutes bacterium]|nr:hypothetical protein [Bacillota bacterium]